MWSVLFTPFSFSTRRCKRSIIITLFVKMFFGIMSARFRSRDRMRLSEMCQFSKGFSFLPANRYYFVVSIKTDLSDFNYYFRFSDVSRRGLLVFFCRIDHPSSSTSFDVQNGHRYSDDRSGHSIRSGVVVGAANLLGCEYKLYYFNL